MSDTTDEDCEGRDAELRKGKMKSVHEWQNDIKQAYLDGRRHEGDTIRDRFAMAAVCKVTISMEHEIPEDMYQKAWDKSAKWAFGLADAMMKERSKNGDR